VSRRLYFAAAESNFKLAAANRNTREPAREFNICDFDSFIPNPLHIWCKLACNERAS
jgi:hypothetical protein